MDDLDSAHFADADTKGFSLINVSPSDDDFLFVSSSDANSVDNQGDLFAKDAHMDQPSDFLALQKPKRPGKCNMRKSLAWDSAFFTSAGVLDAEELSSIIEGGVADIDQNRHLPGIQEELSKSTDSITTFESDSLTLESLEADLFCDIRASIQRSSRKSNSANSNEKGEPGNGCSRKIFQPSSGNMVKPKLPSRKLIPTVTGPGRMLKPASVSKQVTKPVVRNRELSSTLPRSQAPTAKSSVEEVATTKRTSVGASRAQPEINQTGTVKGAGKEALISKGPHRVDSRKTLQKSLSSSKLPSASSVLNRTAIRGSLSSYDTSSSSSTTTKSNPQNDFSSNSSSENIRKSLLDVRRNIDRNANLQPGSKIRTPSRLPVISKPRPGGSQLSAYVKLTSKSSPSVSPTSSISEWSIESSSSTSTVNQKPSGLKHSSVQDVVAEGSVSQNMPKDSNDRSLGRHDYQSASMLSQSTKQPSTSPAPSVARPGSAKPSGLRLPSPKIGYFDGAKAGTKTPSGSARSRSALPSNLPKLAGGNHSHLEPANKAKPGNIAVKVSTSAARIAKLDPHKSHASPKLTRQNEDQSVNLQSQHDSGTFSEVSKTLRKSPLEKTSVVAMGVYGENVAVSGVDAKNHSADMQKPLVSMIVYDTSIELPDYTSIDSAFEGSSVVSDEVGGQHFSEVSFTAIDHPGVVLKTSSVWPVDGESETNSELPQIERDTEVSEVTIEAKTPDDLWSPKLSKEVQDHSVDLQRGNDSGIFSEVSETTLSASPIERISLATNREVDGESETNSLDLQSGNDSGIFYEGPETTLPASPLERISLATNREVDGESELPGTERDTEVAELTKGAKNPDGLCSPKLSKEVQDHSQDLQSSNDSGTISEVSETTLPPSPLERISFAANREVDGGEHVAVSGSDAKNHEKAPVLLIVNDGSDTSIELGESNSALERKGKISSEMDGGNYTAEVSFLATNHSEMVLKTPTVPTFDDEPESNSQQLKCSDISIELPESTSIDSVLEGSSVVSDEVGEQHFSDVSFTAEDHPEVVLKTSIVQPVDGKSETNSELPETERETEIAEIAKGAKNLDESWSPKLSKVQDHSVDLQSGNDFGIYSGFSETTLPPSPLERITLAANREADGGEHVAVSGSDAENHEKASVLLIVDDGSSNSALERKCDEMNRGNYTAEVSFIAKNHSEMVLKTSTVPIFNDEAESNSQQLRCSSPEIVRDSEVPNEKLGVEYPDSCDSVFEDDFVA
ncbi:hypothetical protein vseg_013630 [Gypsophila vaccaria]